MTTDETLHDLAALGAARRSMGERSPDQISTRLTSTGLLVCTFRYPCGHEHATALLTPPKECPACRKERYARDNEEALRRRLLSLMARSAAERAERAHVYRKRHLICRLCFLSRAADAKTLCEAHAGIFSWRDPWRGFKIENGGAA